MKKNLLYVGLLIGLCLPFSSCNKTETEIIQKQHLDGYNLDFVDYSSLPDNSNPKENKYFSTDDPAKNYLSQWLTNKYFQVSDNSSIIVSYDFYQDSRPAYLKKYDNDILVVNYRDYMNVWGNPYVNSLTPTKSPVTEIPKVLNSKISNPVNGDKKVVEYNYSDQEPTTIPDSHIYYVNEDFSSANHNLNNLEDWVNTTRNASRTWELRTFSGTYFTVMATANGIVDPNITSLDSWLISKELDLTQAIDPKFSFDLGMGFYSNESFFSVYVSSVYELGEKILLNEWDDISPLFNLPQSSTSINYGPLIKYGEVSLKNYVGKKIRLGFRYTGRINPELNRSTSYELDNIVVHEIANRTTISSSKTNYDVYEYSGSSWARSTNNTYVLQPEDYTYLNVQSIDKDKASLLIPNVLKRKTDLPAIGKLLVVYKSTTNHSYADEFENINGVWTQVSPKEIIRMKDEYQFYDNSWNYNKTLE